jgi:hypothetical protein
MIVNRLRRNIADAPSSPDLAGQRIADAIGELYTLVLAHPQSYGRPGVLYRKLEAAASQLKILQRAPDEEPEGIRHLTAWLSGLESFVSILDATLLEYRRYLSIGGT